MKAGRGGDRTSAVRDLLAASVQRGDLPGATWVVARGRRLLSCGAVGFASLASRRIRARSSAVYDLASLTKPLATAALAVLLARDGVISLDEPAAERLPEWSGSPHARATLLDLLLHRSGLPAWDPLYLHGRGWSAALRRIAALPPLGTPGASVVYSDPGYIALGAVLARASRRSLTELFGRCVQRRRVPSATEPRFLPPSSWRTRIAPTEDGNGFERELAAGVAGRNAVERYRGWRTGIIRGEPHDQNAQALGGAAGHAGLFGSARGVAALAAEFLPGSALFEGDELTLFVSSRTPGLAEDRSVGFQIATTRGSAAGPGLSPRAFGHTGFTGTSLFIDPDTAGIYVLLTNRVHPRRRDFDMNGLRRAFHTAAAPLVAPAPRRAALE